MFVLFLVLFLGGIYLMSAAFNVAEFPGLVFTGGLLVTSAAVGIPFLIAAVEHRGEERSDGSTR
ncbi:hypothetical protein MTS1_02006 [Microbacterium sp. TS-1]|uniref:hypothetical protein n=1 Tax=Microbacterium sp. TS-1 TaxID=1344956 RepID=UPI00039005D8|nr:hypothetical protein [Microbacterium sp. TS-1]GAD34639.1 hypothetical protein MTS1_02006 [Microbacterium sp. TS-1]